MATQQTQPLSTTKSTDQPNTRYNKGGITTINPTSLGWWERNIIPRSYDDVTIIIDKRYAGRPDLLAYDVYGRSSYMWIILQMNNIVDLNVEFAEGSTVYVPTVDRVMTQILAQQPQQQVST